MTTDTLTARRARLVAEPWSPVTPGGALVAPGWVVHAGTAHLANVVLDEGAGPRSITLASDCDCEVPVGRGACAHVRAAMRAYLSGDVIHTPELTTPTASAT